MNKRILYGIIGLALLVGLFFVGRNIRYSHFPITLEPGPNWETYISSLDAQNEVIMVEAQDGTLIETRFFIPNGGSDQKAAVVWTGGSGDGAYHNYAWELIETYVLDIFLERDMVVILTNKRGVGESEGDWAHFGIEGRASDMYDIVQFAQQHPAIDPNNVGLIGHSQGGWVVTHVAANYPDIAFYISLAGPTTSIATNLEDNAYHMYTCQGYTGAERQKKIEQKQQLAQVGVTLGNLTHFQMWHNTALIMDFDPADDLLRVEAPGLFVYAENDDQVTPQWSLDRLDELFDGEVPDNFTTHVLDDATHAFRLVDDPCDSWVDVPEQPRSEELTVVLNDWLDVQGY